MGNDGGRGVGTLVQGTEPSGGVAEGQPDLTTPGFRQDRCPVDRQWGSGDLGGVLGMLWGLYGKCLLLGICKIWRREWGDLVIWGIDLYESIGLIC